MKMRNHPKISILDASVRKRLISITALDVSLSNVDVAPARFSMPTYALSASDFLKKAYEIIRDYCRTRSTLGAKLMGDKDDRKQRREEEAARIVHVLADSNVSPQRLLWNELDQLMERAKHKYLK